jgi:hypothetical protein
MDAEKGSGETVSANEGEGNKTAAREYNEAQHRFVKSGQVEEKARDAEQALDGAEGEELLKAEAIGKSRSAGDDTSAVLSPEDEKIRDRAYEIWERDGRPEGRHEDHWHQATRDIAGSKP